MNKIYILKYELIPILSKSKGKNALNNEYIP